MRLCLSLLESAHAGQCTLEQGKYGNDYIVVQLAVNLNSFGK